ncbi:hypothetical protein JOQ06_013284 [Pogonophryne albipinna]|uniref:Uncharacterized protein n=1 Tax=Pogonophryne albipinna TaxID=1090488 RepID=A0AAD6BJE1_9TELE|nr:hypothetical protein JOQ06_013284 [Pogonophryne albipinna]
MSTERVFSSRGSRGKGLGGRYQGQLDTGPDLPAARSSTHSSHRKPETTLTEEEEEPCPRGGAVRREAGTEQRVCRTEHREAGTEQRVCRTEYRPARWGLAG